MKNMKIATKLITGFLIVAVLAAAVGVVGIVGMSQITKADTELYEYNLLAIENMGLMSDRISQMRMYIRNICIYEDGTPQAVAAEKAVTDLSSEITEYVEAYRNTITEKSDQDTFDEIMRIYNDVLMKTTIPGVIEAGRKNDFDTAIKVMDATAADIDHMNDLLDESLEYNSKLAEDISHDNDSLSKTMTAVAITVLLIAVVASIALGLYISNIISKPTKYLSHMMDVLAETGNFQIEGAEIEQIENFMKSKDETGDIAHAFSELLKMILVKCDALETVAGGDLSLDVVRVSDKDTIGNSMTKMVDNLNHMFSEINGSSRQVSTGSVQIADGAQLLAQGATEQSATVEQLSASIAEIAAQTKTNAGTATETSELAETIKISAEQGSRQMQQMMEAVAEINESSKSIGKVIKIIDDIAFQTNILALNAAVEAARAGQHGKGFAVVADEVRSLAAKSAEAAKNTNELIESSIQKAEQGASISSETSESLHQIVEGIIKSSELVATIARSSNEQSIAINQIGEAIDQVSQVVQQNSATAEESAAASEEMSGQATLLQQLIAQFKLKESVSGGTSGFSSNSSPSPAPISSSSSTSGFSMDAGGKY